MDLKKTFATNKNKEVQGVWMPGPDGSSFRVARLGNENFTKLSGVLMKPYRKLIQMGQADDKVISQIAAEVTSRTILLDWKGVKDGGADVPYSTEAAKARLLEYPDFADFISALSAQQSQYQDEAEEGERKNS
jgi:hypothetical protein